MKTKCVKLAGTITKILPDNRFMVKESRSGTSILCYLSGKLKRGYKPIEGSSAEIEVDSTNISLGRIVKWR
jgi:translation initiation factor IF-1